MAVRAWPRRLASALLALLASAATVVAAAPAVIRVAMPAAAGPVSGRLLLFAEPLAVARAAARGGEIRAVDSRLDDPRATAVAAMEIHDLSPGAVVAMDADILAYPKAFSALAPGPYAVQAVLDVNHHYAYGGREPGDWLSPVTEVELPAGGAVTLAAAMPPAPDPWAAPPNASAELKGGLAQVHADTQLVDFLSPLLSRFWGRPVHMRGWVLTPPGYGASQERRYPTVYFTQGFGGALGNLAEFAIYLDRAMADGSAPPMIWVLLDQSSPTGTHEFADSVNNGPWGQALTSELIPDLERRWRMDARARGRFLNGHSSGGWASLWLQTRYPKLFGGAWSTSPDPVDFHDFTGTDLYAPAANLYRRRDGSPRPLVRDHLRVLATMEDYARIEAVKGEYGGQMASFDWVFSPRAPDGRPEPMFDHVTGVVDPAVVAYWRDNYDIAFRVARDWPRLKPDLDGRLHIIVGTADTFYLDGAAHRLKAVLDTLGARSDVRFVPDRTHFDLYRVGDDNRALIKQIAWEMYAVARPGSRPPERPPQPDVAGRR